MKKNTKIDLKEKKQIVNNRHIDFYDKTLDILFFMLDEYSKDLTRADVEFLEIPKGVIASLDFLISSIIKVQKGQRLALGLDDSFVEDTTPQINIIEGVTESKI